MLHREVSDLILDCFFEVHAELGHGFLESVYEGAMEIALVQKGLSVKRQHEVLIHFRSRVVGAHKIDIVVNDLIAIELKAVTRLAEAHCAQLLHYLSATRFEVGYLFNFSHQAQFRRFIVTNDRKRNLPESNMKPCEAV